MSDDPLGWAGHCIAGKYRVDALVDEGGFACVYRGHHLELDHPVALKCLRIPATLRPADREQFLHAFREEGRLLHRLSRAHAGIVQALDLGAAESPLGVWTPYLVLEWLEGETLERLLARRDAAKSPFTLAEAMAVLEPAVEALDVAHRLGVAHRDVKPANLYATEIAGKRVLKVLDFGIAKVMQNRSITAAQKATAQSFKAFTPQYAAPEQFDSRKRASGTWTDTYALALILTEMLAGRHAQQGEDAVELSVRAADPKERPTPRHHGVAVSDEVERVFARALAVEPVERYGTAGELWQALCEAVRQGERGTTVLFPEVLDTPISRRGGLALDVAPGEDEAAITTEELADDTLGASEEEAEPPAHAPAGATRTGGAADTHLAEEGGAGAGAERPARHRRKRRRAPVGEIAGPSVGARRGDTKLVPERPPVARRPLARTVPESAPAPVGAAKAEDDEGRPWPIYLVALMVALALAAVLWRALGTDELAADAGTSASAGTSGAPMPSTRPVLRPTPPVR